MEFTLDSLDISAEKEIQEIENKDPDSDAVVDSSSRNNEPLINVDVDGVGQRNALTDLSSWEKWLLKKTIDGIQRKKKQKEQLIQAKVKEKEEKLKRKERRMKARECHKKWVNEKDEEALKKRKERSQQKELESLEMRTKKLNRERKSQECFQEWYQMKIKQQKEQKKLETEKHHIKMKEQEHKQRLAERAYRDWLQQTKRRDSRPEKWWTNTKETHKNPSWIGPLDDFHEFEHNFS